MAFQTRKQTVRAWFNARVTAERGLTDPRHTHPRHKRAATKPRVEAYEAALKAAGAYDLPAGQ